MKKKSELRLQFTALFGAFYGVVSMNYECIEFIGAAINIIVVTGLAVNYGYQRGLSVGRSQSRLQFLEETSMKSVHPMFLGWRFVLQESPQEQPTKTDTADPFVQE